MFWRSNVSRETSKTVSINSLNIFGRYYLYFKFAILCYFIDYALF